MKFIDRARCKLQCQRWVTDCLLFYTYFEEGKEVESDRFQWASAVLRVWAGFSMGITSSLARAAGSIVQGSDMKCRVWSNSVFLSTDPIQMPSKWDMAARRDEMRDRWIVFSLAVSISSLIWTQFVVRSMWIYTFRPCQNKTATDGSES
jgi:hypothetical protein